MQGRAPTALATSAPMVPAFLQVSALESCMEFICSLLAMFSMLQQKAKPEALPMGLTYQHPHQATQSPGPSTKNIVATKASQVNSHLVDQFMELFYLWTSSVLPIQQLVGHYNFPFDFL